MSDVRVGVAVVIKREGRVLFGLRHGSHAAGQWALPGGKVDYGEELEECVVREVLEETALNVRDVRPLGIWSNDRFDSGEHYVTLFYEATADADPVVAEPNKCRGWEWREWDDLPTPLMIGTSALVATGYRPD